MNLTHLPHLKIGALEAALPIIQGGMGIGISLAGLASAVANQGGIGVISATGIGSVYPELGPDIKAANPEALRQEIRKARSKTKGLLGVNILIALTDFGDLAKTAFDEGIDFIFLGAGLPLYKPEGLTPEDWRAILTKVVPIVSSGRTAKLICKHWQRHYKLVPDAFVVEGPLAGGHLGFTKHDLTAPEHQLEFILRDVINAIQPFEQAFNKPISVIAGGGIFSGEDIFKYLQLGAQGVQIASRFVATYECDAADSFKQAYVNCKKDDLIIIDSPVGLPGRALKNQFLENVANKIQQPMQCPWKCLHTCDFQTAPYCIAEALLSAHTGKLEDGFVFAGANAYKIEKIVSVKELIDSLLAEYTEVAEYFWKKVKQFDSKPSLIPIC